MRDCSRFRLGLLINPMAGIGGPAGLKGSDDIIEYQALANGGHYRAQLRAAQVLEQLHPYEQRIELLCAPAAMGGQVAEQTGFSYSLVGELASSTTSGQDTERIAHQLQRRGIDLLLFVGGDGTARNVCNALGTDQAVLGVPAGVKMHSGVFAINPQAAAELVKLLVDGQLVDVQQREVRDIDEEAFRQGQVKSQYYGDLLVPEEGQFVQRVKAGGREVEALVLDDIAAEVIDEMDDDVLYIIAPGSTTRAVMDALGLPATLLGVDLVLNRQLLAADVSAKQIDEQVKQFASSKIVLTPIGGQGILFGRGNQQITAQTIRRIGKGNICVIATKTKISELAGQALLLDTNDPQLDRDLCGYIPIITGYRDRILYPLSDG